MEVKFNLKGNKRIFHKTNLISLFTEVKLWRARFGTFIQSVQTFHPRDINNSRSRSTSGEDEST